MLQGSLLVLAANMTAATLSFTLARTVGQSLAKRIVAQELDEAEVR